MKVLVLTGGGNPVRSGHLASAMADGIRRHGETLTVEKKWNGSLSWHVVVAYGWDHEPVFEAFKAGGRRYVYMDLGYWNRKPDTDRMGGSHKVAVNARHPTAYFRQRHDDARLRRHIASVAPWKATGRHVLVAGTSARAAVSHGLAPQEWEREAIAEIRRYTDRPIVYRPKPTPTWRDAPAIEGALFSPPSEPLAPVLADAWAVVTRHSNVGAVDAPLAGIPCFCEGGVGAAISPHRDGRLDLSRIETPHRPEDRWEYLSDVAWCQWTPAEMRSGACWEYLRGVFRCM